MTVKIDTEIRHITPAGKNIFSDLGFDDQEAASLHADSMREIKNAIAIKKILMAEIASWIHDKNLKQAEAATILHISRPRVSDVVNLKVGKFTIDFLVTMLNRIGKPVSVSIG